MLKVILPRAVLPNSQTTSTMHTTYTIVSR